MGENMQYNAFIEQILKCDPLKEVIRSLQDRTGAMNLIVPNWREVLTKSPVYQRHREKSVQYTRGRPMAGSPVTVRTIIAPENQYNVVIAGVWSLSQLENMDYSVVCRQCDPLRQIGLSMQEGPHQNLHDGGRFFVNVCDPKYCHHCLAAHERYKMPLASKNWCVLSTRTFDGKNLKNEFTKSLQESMKRIGTFMAIFHMRVLSRTTYEGGYKIGGQIKEMIVFQQSSLMQVEQLNFDEERLLPYVPSIEYPAENKDEK